MDRRVRRRRSRASRRSARSNGSRSGCGSSIAPMTRSPAPFMPRRHRLVRWRRSRRCVLEDLSDAHWPPPWSRRSSSARWRRWTRSQRRHALRWAPSIAADSDIFYRLVAGRQRSRAVSRARPGDAGLAGRRAARARSRASGRPSSRDRPCCTSTCAATTCASPRTGRCWWTGTGSAAATRSSTSPPGCRAWSTRADPRRRRCGPRPASSPPALAGYFCARAGAAADPRCATRPPRAARAGHDCAAVGRPLAGPPAPDGPAPDGPG